LTDTSLTSQPTPYRELNAVLEELLASVQHILVDQFIGLYLQGSFAVGDFDAHSDCDFVVVVDREFSESQCGSLQAMHERIFGLRSEWARHLEGSYFPKDLLRDHALTDADLWYLDNGSRLLERSRHDNTVVVRWILRERGVALAGPPASTLIDPVPSAVLRLEILQAFTDWAEEILADPQQIDSRFYQSFAVLSYCRMLHDLHTGVIGSKRSGAAWTKRRVDPSWHDLIDRAWAGRPNPAVSSREPANPGDLARTLEFIRVILKLAQDVAATLPLAVERTERP
jgi:predicted nucleotidyltransferase